MFPNDGAVARRAIRHVDAGRAANGAVSRTRAREARRSLARLAPRARRAHLLLQSTGACRSARIPARARSGVRCRCTARARCVAAGVRPVAACSWHRLPGRPCGRRCLPFGDHAHTEIVHAGLCAVRTRTHPASRLDGGGRRGVHAASAPACRESGTGRSRPLSVGQPDRSTGDRRRHSVRSLRITCSARAVRAHCRNCCGVPAYRIRQAESRCLGPLEERRQHHHEW